MFMSEFCKLIPECWLFIALGPAPDSGKALEDGFVVVLVLCLIAHLVKKIEGEIAFFGYLVVGIGYLMDLLFVERKVLDSFAEAVSDPEVAEKLSVTGA